MTIYYIQAEDPDGTDHSLHVFLKKKDNEDPKHKCLALLKSYYNLTDEEFKDLTILNIFAFPTNYTFSRALGWHCPQGLNPISFGV